MSATQVVLEGTDPDAWLAQARAAAGPVILVAPPGLIACDAAGEPVAPPRIGPEAETEPDAGWLAKQWNKLDLTPEIEPSSEHIGAKLSFLHRTDEASFGRMAKALTPLAWVHLQLTGRAVTCRSDAVASGAWFEAEHRWRTELLGPVNPDSDWERLLPEVFGEGYELGQGVVLGA